MSKLPEGQVCKITDPRLEDNKILNENQWGFRKRKSTQGLLLNLTKNWKQALDEGNVMGVLFVDFRFSNQRNFKEKTVSIRSLQ